MHHYHSPKEKYSPRTTDGLLLIRPYRASRTKFFHCADGDTEAGVKFFEGGSVVGQPGLIGTVLRVLTVPHAKLNEAK